MRIAHVYFLLAGLTGLAAASLAAAATFEDYDCWATPVPVCPSPCGCPTVKVVQDICAGVLPHPGSKETADWYCVDYEGFTCTEGNRPCHGGEDIHVHRCNDCFNCGTSCCPDLSEITCKETTTEKNGMCDHGFGCTSS